LYSQPICLEIEAAWFGLFFVNSCSILNGTLVFAKLYYWRYCLKASILIFGQTGNTLKAGKAIIKGMEKGGWR
jgi:hypothetical protein